MKMPPVWSSAILLLTLVSTTSAATPCSSSQLAVPLVVEDTAGALQLAAAANCSGGSFDVDWVGLVIVEETIRLFGGSTLSITGAVDGTSVVNGANRTSLFDVDGGTLHLNHLTLSNGIGERGGAIYATEAIISAASCTFSSNAGVHGGGVFLNSSGMETTNSSFSHNTASGSGGAMYMWASNVTVGELVLFENNGASNGGAVHVNGSSILNLASANISFARNTATAYGGGLHVYESTANVTGSAVFIGNTAEFGGAAYSSTSTLNVDGDLLFLENIVSHSGGALYSDLSSVNISGNALWENNRAPVDGGGLLMWKSNMSVQHSGTVAFVGNAADSGGAVFIDNSMLIAYGDVSFSANLANINGGALYMEQLSVVDVTGLALWEHNTAGGLGGAVVASYSEVMVQFDGKTAFVNNTAVSFGGAAYVSDSSLSFDGDVRFSNNSAHESGGALSSDASAINILGIVAWINNSAVVAGGALSMWRSTLHTRSLGTVEFCHNTANSGGAIYSSSDTLLFDGDVVFASNFASYLGGSLFSDRSSVNIMGTVLWEHNTALYRGGALEALGSDIFVHSSGKAAFVNNAATDAGGAAYVSNSSLVFDGDVVFADNVASDSGGALYSDFSSSGGALYSDLSFIEITGTAVWKSNSADNGGGGLLMWKSTLLVPSFGTAEFFGNSANSGGAGYLYNSSTLLFDGEVFFRNNFADDFGGALFIQTSVINVTGTAVWENNTSHNTGGGVSLLESTLHAVAGSNVSFSKNTANAGAGMYLGEKAAVFFAGLANFSHNVAETGAGIKMATFSSANFTGSVIMLGNAASSSGGGMHCESPTLLRLDGVHFESNYGGVRGGALTALLAGTERVAETEAKAATVSNCSFYDNDAADAGGAFFIGGGFVEITDSRFYNNIAGRSGGAILASGIVWVDDCTFEGNQAVTGSAVTNTVWVSFSYVEFINNTLLCDDSALFLDWNDTSSFATACESCAGDCFNCTVENPNKVQECQPVLEHSTSLSSNGALESLALQRGFWRSSGTSREIRECYEPSACVGGAEEYQYCNEGYQGPLCAVCADGYTAALGYTCTQCNVERRSATITIAAVVLAAVLAAVAQGLRFLGIYGGQTATEEAAPTGDVAAPQSRFIGARATQALKVVVVSWQLVTQFSMVASVTYPDLYNTFLKYVNVVNLNLGWMLSAGCLVDTNFYDNLLVSTIGPLVVLGVVATSYRVSSSNQSTNDRQTRARIDHRHASALFWVSFLVYSTASSAIFQTFACVDFDNGMSYLRVDHSLECYTTKHTLFRVYASVMSVLYPFGVPFCYAVILYRDRGGLKDAMARETSTTDGSALRELWVAYRPEAYFYEVVECVRRVVLSGVVVFIFPNTAGQIAVAFLLALFFAAVFMVLDPYTSWFDTWAARTGHTVVLMSFFVALLEKVNIDKDEDFSQDVFAGVLVLANCVMVVAAGAEACGMCFVTVREIRQPVPSLSTASSASSGLHISRHDDFPAALGENVEHAHYVG